MEILECDDTFWVLFFVLFVVSELGTSNWRVFVMFWVGRMCPIVGTGWDNVESCMDGNNNLMTFPVNESALWETAVGRIMTVLLCVMSELRESALA